MTAPTITPLPVKSHADCARCHGAARYSVEAEGSRPVKLCVWCKRRLEREAS